MMFSAKISFYLFDITKGRILSTGSGIGIQNGIVEGSYSENSFMSDFLAKFDCEAEVEDSSKNFQINNLILEEVNGYTNNILITITNSLKTDTINFTGNEIEKKYGKKKYIVSFYSK